jgi:hypothetical protein
MAVSDNFVLYDQVSLKPQVRLFETDKITEILVADKENCKNFYKPKINEGDLIRCTNEKYNPGQLYYRVVYGIESSKIYNQDSFITG